jgi:hypothetical protein
VPENVIWLQSTDTAEDPRTQYSWDDIIATETALGAFLSDQPMPNLGLPTFDLTPH